MKRLYILEIIIGFFGLVFWLIDYGGYEEPRPPIPIVVKPVPPIPIVVKPTTIEEEPYSRHGNQLLRDLGYPESDIKEINEEINRLRKYMTDAQMIAYLKDKAGYKD